MLLFSRLLGIALLLSGALLFADAILRVSLYLFNSLPDNWQSVDDPRLMNWFIIRAAAPFVASLGLALMRASSSDKQREARAVFVLGIGLCVQGLFPFACMRGFSLGMRQQLGMLSVICFLHAIPVGLVLLIISWGFWRKSQPSDR